MTTVLVSRWYSQKLVTELEGRLPGVSFVYMSESGDVPSSAADARVLLRCAMDKPAFRNALSQASALEWVHTCTAGFDQLLIPELIERRLAVTRGAHTHDITIAEWVMASLLTISKQFDIAAQAQAQRRWLAPTEWAQPVELFGATMGIIGAGAIGTEVARRARGFGMSVIATKRSPEDLDEYDEVLPPSKLHSVLERSDFVVIACPLTPETRGMIGATEFGLMKRSAYLNNIARGAVIQEAALIEALETGQIAGAVLDVFEQEPLPPTSPLWTTRNLLVTPHASNRSAAAIARGLDEFVENMRRFLAKEPLMNPLKDPELGY